MPITTSPVVPLQAGGFPGWHQPYLQLVFSHKVGTEQGPCQQSQADDQVLGLVEEAQRGTDLPLRELEETRSSRMLPPSHQTQGDLCPPCRYPRGSAPSLLTSPLLLTPRTWYLTMASLKWFTS